MSGTNCPVGKICGIVRGIPGGTVRTIVWGYVWLLMQAYKCLHALVIMICANRFNTHTDTHTHRQTAYDHIRY